MIFLGGVTMPWCPKCKCKYEYREGFTTCSDCESELVEELEKIDDSKKKKFKLILFISIFCLIVSLFYCVPQISFNSDTNAAKSVVKEYFKYYNSGNIDSVVKTLSGQLAVMSNSGISYDIKNTRFVKLLYIKDAPKLISGYRTNGLGATENPYDVRVFNITFIKIYKNHKLSPAESGLRSIHINVTKKTKDSPWRITSMGEG
jgi:hypothetical protein